MLVRDVEEADLAARRRVLEVLEHRNVLSRREESVVRISCKDCEIPYTFNGCYRTCRNNRPEPEVLGQ
jgi:hypothetical protein